MARPVATYSLVACDLDGLSAEAVVEQLTAADPGRDERQLGVVDAQGRLLDALDAAQAAGPAGPSLGRGFP